MSMAKERFSFILSALAPSQGMAASDGDSELSDSRHLFLADLIITGLWSPWARRGVFTLEQQLLVLALLSMETKTLRHACNGH